MSAQAEQAIVAVASNFQTTAEKLVDAFSQSHDGTIILTHGSTGKLYAQIINGAPIDVFLSADQARPEFLMSEGLATAQKTYAIGQLVLMSADGSQPSFSMIADPDLRLALADPATAPYGTAARQVLQSERGQDLWSQNVVLGESVGQAFGFVVTGNVPAGLVAKAQIVQAGLASGFVEIPQELYEPILQDAVLLKRAEGNPAAEGFFDFLGSEKGMQIIAEAGYIAPQ